MEKIQLKEETIKKLHELQQKERAIIFTLGELEYNKLRINNKKEELTQNINSLQSEYQQLGEELQKQYGEGQINLETGEFIKTK